MKRQKAAVSVLAGLLLLTLWPSLATADINRHWGRLSFFAQGAMRDRGGGENNLFSELIGTLSLRSETAENGGLEYAIDTRIAGYPSTEERKERISVYDAYLGWRTKGGVFGIRAGQIWLNDLGALGSLGGAVAEIRPWKQLPFGLGDLKIGVFGGLEPKILEAGYVTDIKKFGGYFSLSGSSARKHVLGYVNLRNQNLTERSVLYFSNFIPIKRNFYLYQAAEYDLQGPGGRGSGTLSYLFTNVRFSPWSFLEVQGLYHHGRSIDSRTIAGNILNGRPVSESALEGYLFESLGGRLTVRPFSGFQVFAGYAQDKTNFQEEKRDRLTLGLFSSNLLESGFDLRVSGTQYKRAGGSSSDSWYFSLGRTFGRSLYLEGYYQTAVSVLRVVGGDITVERRPYTDLFGLSSVIYITRRASLLLTLERTKDDWGSEIRALMGVSYRF